MRKIAVCSWATSKFTKDSKKPLIELACDPCIQILKNNVLEKQIDAVLFSSCSTDQYAATIIAEFLGIRPKMAYRIDNLCNSGTNAIASGFALIASGLCDSVLVVGAEKKDSPGNRLLWDVTRGEFTFPVHWAALFAKAHMRKYGTTEQQMAEVSVKNHENAAKNPCALFNKRVNLEEVLHSRKIVDPIKLLDCSATCDGSSAVLLVSEEKAKKFANPIWIKGIGQQTNSASFTRATSDLTTIESAKQASRDAFRISHVSPNQVDVAELHDAFTILEILAYEDLGFVKKGDGGKFVNQHNIGINPRGGIIGCGHPVGTTGVAQVAEIASQLAGMAGKRQVKGCKIGLVHNLAAAGSSATVLVLGAQ